MPAGDRRCLKCGTEAIFERDVPWCRLCKASLEATRRWRRGRAKTMLIIGVVLAAVGLVIKALIPPAYVGEPVGSGTNGTGYAIVHYSIWVYVLEYGLIVLGLIRMLQGLVDLGVTRSR
jgi:hypothetical protein